MRLNIDGVWVEFTNLKTFRSTFALPDTFGVAHFQPKRYDGLGSIDGAGVALNRLRAETLAALPASISLSRLFTITTEVGRVFARSLAHINDQVGLKPVEVDFAVAGFNDMSQAYAYALVRAHLQEDPPPDVDAIYQLWLNASVRTASPVIEYAHGEQVWGVQVIAHAYGRIGLIVAMPDGTHYVYDPSLACPAEGFMAALLRDVCTVLQARLTSP